MSRSLLIFSLLSSAIVSGCSDALTGDYLGEFGEACGVSTPTTDIEGRTTGEITYCTEESVVTNFELEVTKGKGEQILVYLLDCNIAFVRQADGRSAKVTSGQRCPLSNELYNGPSSVTGDLSVDDGTINFRVSLAPVEDRFSGADSVVFTGKRQ